MPDDDSHFICLIGEKKDKITCYNFQLRVKKRISIVDQLFSVTWEHGIGDSINLPEDAHTVIKI